MKFPFKRCVLQNCWYGRGDAERLTQRKDTVLSLEGPMTLRMIIQFRTGQVSRGNAIHKLRTDNEVVSVKGLS
jgi:hypothetical protein